GGRHPLPEAGNFAKTLTELGISKDSHVIIYDDKNGSNAAARFWWMLKAVGHEKVQVLNGGLHEVRKQGFPLSSGAESVRKAAEPYRADKWGWPIATMDEVEKAAQDNDYMVVDVRDKDRYDGVTEPIDLIAGHIPGAINIPFTENLDERGLFLSPGQLKDKYQIKFDDRKPENLIIHCGSGVTACHTILALAHAGMELPKLYVGSWSEWSRNNKKIAKTNR
ncbi:MAG TPA: sulfurtransferase, partial [Sphingobacteriaceae bacterium]|nr:sulfurtransferase [Sphingobacteriaceae bacterium]